VFEVNIRTVHGMAEVLIFGKIYEVVDNAIFE
jgi:hypothetical protein